LWWSFSRLTREVPVVEFMILVFSVLRISSSGLPSTLNHRRKKSTSWWCRTAFTSSTYAKPKPVESSPLSP
jgi:hypothetical protein